MNALSGEGIRVYERQSFMNFCADRTSQKFNSCLEDMWWCREQRWGISEVTLASGDEQFQALSGISDLYPCEMCWQLVMLLFYERWSNQLIHRQGWWSLGYKEGEEARRKCSVCDSCMMTKAQLREHSVRLARKAGSKCSNCSLCKTKEAQLEWH